MSFQTERNSYLRTCYVRDDGPQMSRINENMNKNCGHLFDSKIYPVASAGVFERDPFQPFTIGSVTTSPIHEIRRRLFHFIRSAYVTPQPRRSYLQIHRVDVDYMIKVSSMMCDIYNCHNFGKPLLFPLNNCCESPDPLITVTNTGSKSLESLTVSQARSLCLHYGLFTNINIPDRLTDMISVLSNLIRFPSTDLFDKQERWISSLALGCLKNLQMKHRVDPIINIVKEHLFDSENNGVFLSCSIIEDFAKPRVTLNKYNCPVGNVRNVLSREEVVRQNFEASTMHLTTIIWIPSIGLPNELPARISDLRSAEQAVIDQIYMAYFFGSRRSRYMVRDILVHLGFPEEYVNRL